MKYSVHQVSHQGGRRHNEDRLGHACTPRALLLALADGLGGHPEGAKAAEIALRVLTQHFFDLAQPALLEPSTFLPSGLLRAHRAIVEHAYAHAMRDNPKTTLVAALIQDGMMTALHSGDSRLYWVRQGCLLRRTRDHSYHDRPELFRQLPPGAHRGMLFTCLGGSDEPPLYDTMGPVALRPGDRLLLCSDGLWSVMEDDSVAAGMHGLPLADAVNALADQALLRGGRHGDNVSLLGLQWDGA